MPRGNRNTILADARET